ncbi:MAG TPA: helix-turn-helix domain-containing protein [Hyphomicrobiaceae bacterium]|nr:helix-turn-helix domain-containing protein [Hyphomicrobiaceae bacterium]
MNARPYLHTGAAAHAPISPRPELRGLAAMELHTLLDLMVAGVFGVESDLLRLPTRGRARVALARQVAMYLAHVACGLSLTAVGELFERDRTTVAYACGVVERRRDEPSFDGAIELLECIVRVLVGAKALTGALREGLHGRFETPDKRGGGGSKR